jgi:oligopeptide/dipeptide ABC transporter ATP-binding protein
MTRPLLEVDDLHKHYDVRSSRFSRKSKQVRAVDGVSFTMSEGETLGLVGESGCGKSTLARTVLFLESPTSGEIRFQGQTLSEPDLTRLRRGAQMIFQDPYSSLPPRMQVSKIIDDPLIIHQVVPEDEMEDRVNALLVAVGLSPDMGSALPHELSGGQRQRVGIARALAVEPSLVVADEAVSSLDVSVQAQILNLLKDLQEERGLAYLFISHDLGVVKYMSHRIAVMYLGEIVELAFTHDLHQRALHPYTRALMSAVPSIHRRGGTRIHLEGEPPDPSEPPSGCTFHPRCPMAQPICRVEKPELQEWLPGRVAACHFALSTTDDLPPKIETEP